jgi:hypothetical protein
MFIKPLSVLMALAIAAAAAPSPLVYAAGVGAPELSTERLVTPVASKKKYKKYKARKCRKGKVYSKRRHKCVWKKRYRAKTAAPAKAANPAKSVAPAKKK